MAFLFELFLYLFFRVPFVEFLEHITDDRFPCLAAKSGETHQSNY